jgi:2Fe-2S ferredoxin
MPRIRFITHDGEPWDVEATSGESVMAAAVANGVPGIDADCGGGCSCGTCHVIVEPAWFDRTGRPAPMEEGMLGFVPERVETSRLSCQIVVGEALDGLVVRVPEFQM